MQTHEKIRETLAAMIEEEMGEPCPPLVDGLDLRDGLALDSVDLVGIVMGLEREYHIRLSMEELSSVRTVGEMIALLIVKQTSRPIPNPNRREVAA